MESYVSKCFTDADELKRWYDVFTWQVEQTNDNFREVMQDFTFWEDDSEIGDERYTTDFDAGYMMPGFWNPTIEQLLDALASEGSIRIDVYYCLPFFDEEDWNNWHKVEEKPENEPVNWQGDGF